MDDDIRLLEKLRPKSTLLSKPAQAARPSPAETLHESESESSPLDDIALLPAFGSPYDEAYSRPLKMPVPTLRLILGDCIRGLPYANYDSIDWLASDKPGNGPSIVIRFTGLVPREATLKGRNLFKLYDLISNHRVSWVRMLPKGKDFGKGATETVITDISVNRITQMPD